MKQLFVFFFALLFAGQDSQAQSAWGEIKAAIFGSLPQISSPAAQQLGIQFRGHNFVVANGSPLFCQIFIGKKEVARLAPGEIIYDNRHWQAGYQEDFPVAAVCYRDSGYSEFVGVAGRILSLYAGGYPQAIEWTIRLSEIRQPDGNYAGYANAYPQPDFSAKSRRIKLPREWWQSTLGIQTVNNTLFTAEIFINGVSQGAIGTGGIMHLTAREIGGYYYGGRPINFSVVFSDRGRFVGTYERQLWVQQNYLRAEQIILSPYDIRRQ
ncbi:MAG: hypothetical protein ACP5QN_00175 [Minisyncoccia bacterium]